MESNVIHNLYKALHMTYTNLPQSTNEGKILKYNTDYDMKQHVPQEPQRLNKLYIFMHPTIH